MDQTPLPFVIDDNRTYEETGADKVWIASGQLGETPEHRIINHFCK